MLTTAPSKMPEGIMATPQTIATYIIIITDAVESATTPTCLRSNVKPVARLQVNRLRAPSVSLNYWRAIRVCKRSLQIGCFFDIRVYNDYSKLTPTPCGNKGTLKKTLVSSKCYYCFYRSALLIIFKNCRAWIIFY